jgi:hypothetical protein
MVFKWVPVLSIFTALTLVGWGDTRMKRAWAASAESEVEQSESNEDDGRVETLDDLLAEVAARVPGFGGVFLGSNGALHVYLPDGRLARAAQGALEASSAASASH